MSDPSLRLFDRLADQEKSELINNFEKRHTVISSCSDFMIATISTLRDRSWTTHEAIWNSALFLNTVAYDHSIDVVNLAYERDEWKRRYAGRTFALLLFEVSEDIPAVFGKKFRSSAKTLLVPDAQLTALSIETQKASKYWNDHRDALKKIRIIAGAHRDHDAITLHETIMKIDLFNLLRIGIRLGSLLNDLGAATQKILDFTSEVRPPELTQAE